MIEALLLLGLLFGGLWLFCTLLGWVFKLAFWAIGLFLCLIGGLIALPFLLLLSPLILFAGLLALLPTLLPLLFVGAVLWLLLRKPRAAVPAA